MVRGLLKNLVSKSLSTAGKWQQQQLRRLNIHEYQGAELMSKYGINVPKGVAISSLDEVPKVISEAFFPDKDEVVVKSQVLAGGRGLGTFKNGFKGGVHIVKKDQMADVAGFISSWKGSLARAKSSNGSFPCLLGSRRLLHTSSPAGSENRMAFVRGILEQDGFGRDFSRGSQFVGHNVEEKLDVVHIKLMKNNTFITITDSNGNKKAGASSGCLEEMKGGPKLSRYAAEATAEHVGRLARNLELKSVVMRVNGFTHFKKKKQAILSWREGYTYGRGDKNPIAYIEDTTRRPHNGCRLPKRRRV